MRLRYILPCISLMTLPLAGAGCTGQSAPVPVIDSGSLRTPPPAHAPVQAPSVPDEAKNVPKPY